MPWTHDQALVAVVGMKDSVLDVELAFTLGLIKQPPVTVGWFICCAGRFTVLPLGARQGQLWLHRGKVTIPE